MSGRFAAVFAAVLALCLAASVYPLSAHGVGSPYRYAAWWLWLAAIVLASGCALPVRRAPQAPSNGARSADWSTTTAFIALALLVRTFDLGGRPLLNSDEAGFAVVAQELWANAGNPFGFGWFSWPALSHYPAAVAMAIGGPTVAMERLPVAVVGALTVGAIHRYALVIAGRLDAALAALVATVLVLHVHVSRFGLNLAYDALAAIVALGALERGWTERRRGLLLVAGIVVALAQYGYATARVLPLIMLAWLALRVACGPAGARERRGDLVAMAWVTLVAALPMLMLAIAHPADWLAPLGRVGRSPVVDDHGGTGLVAIGAQLARARDAVLGVGVLPLRGPFTSAGPLLPPIILVAAAAGCGVLVRRWRTPWVQLLALWVSAALGVVALSESTPAGHRYVLLVPAAALVAGVGAGAIVQQLAAWRVAYRYAATAVVVALAVQGGWSLHHYLVTPPTHGALDHRRDEVAVDLASRATRAGADARVVVLGGPDFYYVAFRQFRFLNPTTPGYDVAVTADVEQALREACGSALQPGAGRRCLVAVLPYRETQLPRVRAALGTVHEQRIAAVDGAHLYTLLEVQGAATRMR